MSVCEYKIDKPVLVMYPYCTQLYRARLIQSVYYFFCFSQGLKLKRVKSLCYEQLKGMSEDEIKHALQPEDYPALTRASPKITSSSSNQTQAAASSDKTDTSAVEVDRQTMETESKRELDPQSCDGEKDGKEETSPEHSQTLGGLETVTETQRCYTENFIHVSDVSEDEEDTNVEKSEEIEDINKTRTHGQAEQPNKDGDEGSFRVEEEGEKSVESDKGGIRGDSGEAGVCTGLEVGDDSDVVVSEVDAGQLLEMEMRRRALESELKKMSTSTDHELTRKPESQPDHTVVSDLDEDYIEVRLSDSEALDKEIEMERGEAEKTGTLKKKEKGEELRVDGGVDESNSETDTVDAGDLLERLLRQKALQSLLTKKKRNSS